MWVGSRYLGILNFTGMIGSPPPLSFSPRFQLNFGKFLPFFEKIICLLSHPNPIPKTFLTRALSKTKIIVICDLLHRARSKY